MNKLNKFNTVFWSSRFMIVAVVFSIFAIAGNLAGVLGQKSDHSRSGGIKIQDSWNPALIGQDGERLWFTNEGGNAFEAPRYLGCFLDNNLPPGKPRDLSGFEWNDGRMTTERCVASCAQKGFQYAGTQYGSYCFCGNSYGKYGALNSPEGRKCDMPCSGNSGQTCGGAWANSVYAVSDQGSDDYSLNPLKLYFSSARGDNFTTATSVGERSALNNSYLLARTEGYIFHTQVAGTVPLKLYWNAEREDNFTTATSQGEGAAQAAGYQFIRVEGYIYPTQQSGTVPLKNYWSAARGDNFSTATAEGEQHAINSGYKFVWVEGYVLPAPRGSTPTTTPTPITMPTPAGEPKCDKIDGNWHWNAQSGYNFTINPPNFPFNSNRIWATLTREVSPDNPAHGDRWGEYKCIGANRFNLVNRMDQIYLTLTLRDRRLFHDDGRFACINNAECR